MSGNIAKVAVGFRSIAVRKSEWDGSARDAATSARSGLCLISVGCLAEGAEVTAP